MEPLPQIGPINMARFERNRLTAWPNPWTSFDRSFENKDKDTFRRIGILAKSSTVPIENDHKLDRSSEINYLFSSLKSEF